MFGSRRSTPWGNHQFHLPNSSIAVGTSTSRTIVASIAIASAQPSPSSLIDGTPVNANTLNTHTTISAALVIVDALEDKPSTTARLVSPVAA